MEAEAEAETVSEVEVEAETVAEAVAEVEVEVEVVAEANEDDDDTRLACLPPRTEGRSDETEARSPEGSSARSSARGSGTTWLG